MRDRLVAGEDWDLLKAFFPSDWEQLSTTTQAVKGLRQDKSAEHLLRTVMLHVGCGYSLRETVVRARESAWLTFRMWHCSNACVSASNGFMRWRSGCGSSGGWRNCAPASGSCV